MDRSWRLRLADAVTGDITAQLFGYVSEPRDQARLSAGLGLGTLGQMGIARGTLLAARFGDPSQRRVVRPRFQGFTLVSCRVGFV